MYVLPDPCWDWSEKLKNGPRISRTYLGGVDIVTVTTDMALYKPSVIRLV